MVELCLSRCWTYYRCSAPQKLIAGDAGRIALYPGMSMMKVYRDLISLKQVPGVHMMQALILAPPAAHIINLDFPRGRLRDSREMARHLRARFMDQRGESWIYSCKMGTTLAHLPNGRRVFVNSEAPAQAHPASRASLPQAQALAQAGATSLCYKCSELLSDTRYGPAYLPGL
jgi:hypothetical protein